jgi:predicted RNA-binding protein YlxR (DUF448 family)
MVRLVAPVGGGGLFAIGRAGPVPKGKLGRGAWLHPDCLGIALKRGAMARAFRRRVDDVDPETLLAQLQDVAGQSTTVGKAR